MFAASIITTRRCCCANKGRPVLVRSQNRKIHHNIAIARDLPDSFATDAISEHHSAATEADAHAVAPVSMSLARQQHGNYLNELRKHVPVFCLPALPECPDCSFVEDTVVSVGHQSAVITQPGHVSRRGETSSVRQCLHQFGINTIDMSDDAYCDGGDVLNTGRHVFVGLSNRTNDAAVDVLRRAFQDNTKTKVIPVPAIVQGNEVLHLKSAVTHIDSTTLVVPQGSLGDTLLEILRAEELGYTAIRIPNVLACNAVTISGHIIAQGSTTTTSSSCEDDESKLLLQKAAQERNMGITFVDTSELAKKDAALTCCSVFLSV